MKTIIKIEDNEKSVVKNFSLKQFLCIDRDFSKTNKKNGKADAGLSDPERMRCLARREAELIIENARQEAQNIERAAFKKGFAQGEDAGRQKSEKELESLISSFQNIAQKFEDIKNGYYAAHQDIILELSLRIARKVIHQEVQTRKDLVVGVLNSAIKLAIDRERLKIRVNPHDVELCLKKRPEIMKDVDGIKQIIFEPDESIARGGAVVEYAFGEIDARIGQQFAEVERELNNSCLAAEGTN